MTNPPGFPVRSQVFLSQICRPYSTLWVYDSSSQIHNPGNPMKVAGLEASFNHLPHQQEATLMWRYLTSPWEIILNSSVQRYLGEGYIWESIFSLVVNVNYLCYMSVLPCARVQGIAYFCPEDSWKRPCEMLVCRFFVYFCDALCAS